ncbi:MAG: hypothetical protein DRQ98_12815 [Gammaproteobacteria bacterium]|nr:MAG: hypothetical protein DRQ98_12815 [Gammaproteobacteria bacterium]
MYDDNDDSKEQLLDTIAKQQSLINALEDDMSARLSVLEQDNQACPVGYLSKKRAKQEHGTGLSEEILSDVMQHEQVATKTYATTHYHTAYKESEVPPAIHAYIAECVQVTKTQCEHPSRPGKRFRHKKN